MLFLEVDNDFIRDSAKIDIEWFFKLIIADSKKRTKYNKLFMGNINFSKEINSKFNILMDILSQSGLLNSLQGTLGGQCLIISSYGIGLSCSYPIVELVFSSDDVNILNQHYSNYLKDKNKEYFNKSVNLLLDYDISAKNLLELLKKIKIEPETEYYFFDGSKGVFYADSELNLYELVYSDEELVEPWDEMTNDTFTSWVQFLLDEGIISEFDYSGSL
ncbi:MAG: hypothetical protein ACNA7G_15100 [Methylobacter sp.]